MSQIGPHVIHSTSQALDWARRAGVVKTVDNPSVLAAAPADAIRIHRHYWPVAEQRLDADPQAVTVTIYDSLRGYWHPQLYVEVYNEIARQQTAEYAALLQRVVPVLHTIGLRVAGPSWATGDYDDEQWEYMRAHRWCGLDAIALHAYWGNQGLTPWHSLRYRTYWQPGDPPLMVTECGRDAIEGGRGGWRRDGISAETYRTELARFESELARDGVVGVIFTAGPTDDWDAYSTDDLDTSQFAGPARLAVPAPQPPDPEDITVALKDQYPQVYAEWVAAGGVDHAFLAHLLGIGAIKPTADDIRRLASNSEAAAKQLRAALDRYPL